MCFRTKSQIEVFAEDPGIVYTLKVDLEQRY